MKCNVKTKVLANSLTQRITRISMLKGDLKAIWSTHIIAQMGKLRPVGDVLVTATWLVGRVKTRTHVLAFRKVLSPVR